MNALRKEFTEILGDRSFLFSIVVQFLLISMLLFIYSVYSKIAVSPIEVTVAVDKNDTQLAGRLRDAGVRVVTAEPSAAGSSPPLPAGLQGTGGTAGASGGQGAKVVASISSGKITTDPTNVMSGFAIARIKSATDEITFEDALLKANFTYESVSNARRSDFAQMGYAAIIPMAILFPVLVAMALSTQGIFTERKRKTIELLLASPISDMKLTFYKVFPLVAVSTACATAWLLLIMRQIEMENFSLLVLLTLLLSLLAVSTSVIVSSKAQTSREANAISSVIGMLMTIMILLPYSPVSVYLPTVVISRAAANPVDGEMIAGSVLLAAISFLTYFLAVRSVRDLRENYG